MLAVVEPEKLDEAMAVCDKWGLLATVIGEVTDTGRFVVREGNTMVGDMPAATLADDAPIYDPEMKRPTYLDKVQAYDPATLMHPESVSELTEALLHVLASPNICSRQWIYDQYDHQVMVNTVVLPGGDAAVLRIGDTGRGEMTDRGIAVSSDCNGRYCYLDPYLGAQIALAEAARNVACVGGEPAAITDCLNFGSPEKPEVFWTFHEAIRGMSDACKAWDIPVISGNVSFYNESFGQPIYPTPTVGLVGLIDDVNTYATTAFKLEGDVIVLIGETLDELGGSEYLNIVHGAVAGKPPVLDLALERDVQAAVREGVRSGLVKSAHDCSEGGIGVTLAECCVAGNIGADVHLEDDLPAVSSLFSETQSRVVVSVAEADIETFMDLLAEHEVPYSVLGTVGGDRLHISEKVDIGVGTLREAHSNTLEKLVGGQWQPEELTDG
jgi:phosphoribosylformylglycinamidine synthase